ncbi:MAG: M20/M25/M40 family metallo-hydrolase [Planctomycetes bacterium]|nr:M20/M25/M40 family metallo-hydrolase [Planctomycetota bacterium]
MRRLLWMVLWMLVLSATRVERAGAAENLWLETARSSITSHELRNHVGVLADDMLEGREAGSRGGHAAARYIITRLEAAALKPAGAHGTFTQRFQGRSQNLLAVIEGTDPELRSEHIVVGAHYDHVGYGTRRNSYGPWGYIHNGADDNASGVATLLEVIDALVHSGHQPRRSLLFAFWDGEEKGLLGSKHWMRQPTVPIDSVRVAINIDMVGRLTKGRIAVIGTRTGTGFRRLMSTDRLTGETWLDYPWEVKDNSDHWTFYEANIPSLCIHTGVHEDYHRPSDDVEKINFEGMQEVSRYLLEQLCELADAEHLPEFRPAARRETPESRKQTEAPLSAMPSRLDFAWQYVSGKPVVEQILLDGHAAEAGLVAGDRILAVNGRPLMSELPAAVLASESEIALEVRREGVAEAIVLSVPLRGKQIRLGLSWRSDEAEPGAVYVTRVIPFSPAARAGLEVHDRIYAVNGQSSLGQQEMFGRVQKLMDEEATEILLQVESRGVLREVAVSLQLPVEPTGDSTL